MEQGREVELIEGERGLTQEVKQRRKKDRSAEKKTEKENREEETEMGI